MYQKLDHKAEQIPLRIFYSLSAWKIAMAFNDAERKIYLAASLRGYTSDSS